MRYQALIASKLGAQYGEKGSGTGIRTLNLAVKGSMQPVQKQCLEFTEQYQAASIDTVWHWRCCTRQAAAILALLAAPPIACLRPGVTDTNNELMLFRVSAAQWHTVDD